MNEAKSLAGETLAELEDAIIHVLLKNARKNGRHAYMPGFEIGKEIGTYRGHAPSPGDRFGRAHRKLLDKLQDEGGLSLGGVAKLEQVGDSPMQSGID